MVTHHLLDSLAVLPHAAAARARVLDVGTGARLARHSARDRAAATGASTLLDASHKKAAFLAQAAIELRARATSTCVRERVEAWQPQRRSTS